MSRARSSSEFADMETVEPHGEPPPVEAPVRARRELSGDPVCPRRTGSASVQAAARSLIMELQPRTRGSLSVTSGDPFDEHAPTTSPHQPGSRDLAAILHGTLREAVQRLGAASAAVYLLDERHTALALAIASGSPPSLFTIPGRMRLDAPQARAMAVGETALLPAPGLADPGEPYVLPYPYASLSAPVIAANQCLGIVTVLRRETSGNYESADWFELQHIVNGLAMSLVQLAEDGTPIVAGAMPMLVPTGFDSCDEADTGDWGVPAVPGSMGISMMYPVRRLSDLLNQATTMEEIVRAAQYCLMRPFHAQALVLASTSEDRLWVLGHSGASSGIARELHGARLAENSLVARAFQGHSLFIRRGHGSPSEWHAREPQAEAFIPLTGNTELVEFPLISENEVLGVCYLSFEESRAFPPEERAIISMMAGSLGAAVQRVELDSKQREIAECLQRRLLPSALPDSPRLATSARYWPAASSSKVGGDWYDVLRLSDDRMVLIVGDVEGHGLESAAAMGQVRTAIAAYATEGHSPCAVIDRASRLLTTFETEPLVTCCIAILDTLDGTVQIALAGHPKPLVHRHDGTVYALGAPANVPLGTPHMGTHQGYECSLEPESVLMLYSNGLIDWDVEDPQVRAQSMLQAGSREAGDDLEYLADYLIAPVTGTDQHRDDAVLVLARYEGSGEHAAPRTSSMHIHRRDLRGVKAARNFVDAQLTSWGLSGLADTYQLMTSEIVTNALIHADSDVDVRLRAFNDRVRLEVRDSLSNPPIPSPLTLSEEGNGEAEHGRGLLIVEALGGTWSTSPYGRGKTVSIEMPV